MYPFQSVCGPVLSTPSVVPPAAWLRLRAPVDGLLPCTAMTSTYESVPESADRPAWFERAMGTPSEALSFEVNGCTIVADAWGKVGDPGLVLVHGGAAHHEWWRPVAAMLSTTFRVVAPSLSGHGDSGRRSDYRPQDWAAEVMAAAEAGQVFAGPRLPTLVGHSMGGFVAIHAGAAYAERFEALVLVDSPINRPDPEVEAGRSGKIFLNKKYYRDYETARRRFRTVPEQDRYLQYVVDHVIQTSLIESDKGWSWKYDPEIFVPPRSETREMLAAVPLPVALLRSEFGIAHLDAGTYMGELLGRPVPTATIPNAGHHPMLDEPLALVGAIAGLLAGWPALVA